MAVAALQADLYIIHTPHGISLSDSYAVYGNRCAAGNAFWLGQWGEFQVCATFCNYRCSSNAPFIPLPVLLAKLTAKFLSAENLPKSLPYTVSLKYVWIFKCSWLNEALAYCP